MIDKPIIEQVFENKFKENLDLKEEDLKVLLRNQIINKSNLIDEIDSLKKNASKIEIRIKFMELGACCYLISIYEKKILSFAKNLLDDVQKSK